MPRFSLRMRRDKGRFGYIRASGSRGLRPRTPISLPQSPSTVIANRRSRRGNPEPDLHVFTTQQIRTGFMHQKHSHGTLRPFWNEIREFCTKRLTGSDRAPIWLPSQLPRPQCVEIILRWQLRPRAQGSKEAIWRPVVMITNVMVNQARRSVGLA